MMFSAKNKSLFFNDLHMDYVSFGKGQRPLILIPGLSTERVRGKDLQLAYLYRLFAKDFKVYIFDRKDNVQEGYSIAQMAEELAGAMKCLKIEPACVVGISQGGMIAQSLVISHPHLVDKLVLGLTTAKVGGKTQETVEDWISLAKENNNRALVENMLGKMFSESYLRKYGAFARLVSSFTNLKEADRFINLATSILDFDCSRQLDQIKCPSMVIAARQDRVIPCQDSLDLADKLNSLLYIYEDFCHSAYLEAKDFNQRILNFLLT